MGGGVIVEVCGGEGFGGHLLWRGGGRMLIDIKIALWE